jgi:hypothetical protein
MRAAMADKFEFTGNRKHCVRRDAVTEHVAATIGEEVSPKLRTGVALLAKQLGWHPVRNGNRRLFASVKARAMPLDEALERSKELRRK